MTGMVLACLVAHQSYRGKMSYQLELFTVDPIVEQPPAWVVPSEEAQLALSRSFTWYAVETYWACIQSADPAPWPLLALDHPLAPLSPEETAAAIQLGRAAATLEPVQASYLIGSGYARLLPRYHRARYGVFYTPPALVGHLMEMATQAGLDWRTATALDPACGGGAFLAPLALRMRGALADRPAQARIQDIASRLHGFEIDPFGAWLSQVFAEAAMLPDCRAAGVRLPRLVSVCDTLSNRTADGRFDLVIGNPPYGKIRLSEAARATFKRSLFGHGNLYGLFVDRALDLVQPGGLIAFVTPTSFLAGEYFKALRALLAVDAPPRTIDFVADRKGVFEDVLQETALVLFVQSGQPAPAAAHLIHAVNGEGVELEHVGAFELPANLHDPWIIPRTADQIELIVRMRRMPHRLSDYGYAVKTGPLVWNRHKPQLRSAPGPDSYPLVWAESVTQDGQFRFRADQANHKPYLQVREGQQWLLTSTQGVLVKRTTAKEQERRLIAAELPASWVEQHGAVVIENHLNILVPETARPAVSPRALAELLNAEQVDQAFRCISGSVAVSAFELNALPLPDPERLSALERAVADDLPSAAIRDIANQIYSGEIA